MIERIKLKFGKGASSAPLEFPVTPITVFVGPNNSGKSQAIREIRDRCLNWTPMPLHQIIEDLFYRELTDAEARARLTRSKFKPGPGERTVPGTLVIGNSQQRQEIPIQPLVEAMKKPNELTNREILVRQFLH